MAIEVMHGQDYANLSAPALGTCEASKSSMKGVKQRFENRRTDSETLKMPGKLTWICTTKVVGDGVTHPGTNSLPTVPELVMQLLQFCSSQQIKTVSAHHAVVSATTSYLPISGGLGCNRNLPFCSDC